MQKNLKQAIINEIKDAISNADTMHWYEITFEDKFNKDFEEVHNDIRIDGFAHDDYSGHDELIHTFIGDLIPNEDRNIALEKVHQKYNSSWNDEEKAECEIVIEKYPYQYKVDKKFLEICKTMAGLGNAREAVLDLLLERGTEYSLMDREELIHYAVPEFFECCGMNEIQIMYEVYAKEHGNDIHAFVKDFEVLQSFIAMFGLN